MIDSTNFIRRSTATLLFIGNVVHALHAWAQEGEVPKTKEITAEIAAKYALYAMIAANTYHKKTRVCFPVELLGWVQVDVDGKPTNRPTAEKRSGLAYDIFEKKNSDVVIFSFRGTDSRVDYLWANLAVWPFSWQYTQAKKEFSKYLEKHPTKKVTLTGHSLGGSLALSMSVRWGINAVVFDASPRIFDGLGDYHKDAERILIYQKGEILEVVREYWKKISEVIKPTSIYTASFNFGRTNKHRADFLALHLLEFGAQADPSLVPVRNAIHSPCLKNELREEKLAVRMSRGLRQSMQL